MSEQAKPAEKLQVPVAQELLPYLRQYLHNDGSGFVFAYEKAGVDRLVALLQSRVAESARIESEQLGISDKSDAEQLAEHYRSAIATVCEGWTLPADARKVLEAALWTKPAAKDAA